MKPQIVRAGNEGQLGGLGFTRSQRSHKDALPFGDPRQAQRRHDIAEFGTAHVHNRNRQCRHFTLQNRRGQLDATMLQSDFLIDGQGEALRPCSCCIQSRPAQIEFQRMQRNRSIGLHLQGNGNCLGSTRCHIRQEDYIRTSRKNVAGSVSHTERHAGQISILTGIGKNGCQSAVLAHMKGSIHIRDHWADGFIRLAAIADMQHKMVLAPNGFPFVIFCRKDQCAGVVAVHATFDQIGFQRGIVSTAFASIDSCVYPLCLQW